MQPSSQITALPIFAQAGVGLKPDHYQTILETKPDIAWFEIHPENYMADGGAIHHYLEKIRDLYPLSIHGVGLSLGSEEGLSQEHLASLKGLVDRYQPGLVSEHLAWCKYRNQVFNDLLPVPYTSESLEIISRNIDQTQNFLGRQILIENPSSYFKLDYTSYNEWEFLVELVKRSGAGILLDVNNVYVSACNHDFDARHYIESIPPHLVGEIHLAGHSVQHLQDGKVLIDDHGSEVIEEVWDLYDFTLSHLGNRPTLIEWDANIPHWDILYNQAKIADHAMLEKMAVCAGG
ncbi:MAG: DUF692 domain-containing protein [Gammaproteobacteria bacterium]|nr:DUF692 domain-containing protein [Gammaproteobacteria bacterium]